MGKKGGDNGMEFRCWGIDSAVRIAIRSKGKRALTTAMLSELARRVGGGQSCSASTIIISITDSVQEIILNDLDISELINIFDPRIFRNSQLKEGKTVLHFEVRP